MESEVGASPSRVGWRSPACSYGWSENAQFWPNGPLDWTLGASRQSCRRAGERRLPFQYISGLGILLFVLFSATTWRFGSNDLATLSADMLSQQVDSEVVVVSMSTLAQKQHRKSHRPKSHSSNSVGSDYPVASVGLVPSLVWRKEEIYVEELLHGLAADTLGFLSDSPKDHPSKAENNCHTCSMVPFWINPSCMHVCKQSGYEAHVVCWICSHWSIKMKTDFKAFVPDVSSQDAVLFQMPILNGVVKLIHMAWHHDAQALNNLYGKTNKGAGADVLDDIKDSLAKLKASPLAHKTSSKLASSPITSDAVFSLDRLALVDSGGGGGMGLQVVCDGVTRFSVGGGGGQGWTAGIGSGALESFGGGRGAGLQIFDRAGVRILTLGGGGGGGTTKASDAAQAANETGVAAHHVLSAGGNVDQDAQIATNGMLETLRKDLRSAWNRGTLHIYGGGGMGGGLDGDSGKLASGDLSFSFGLVKSPCSKSCLRKHPGATALPKDKSLLSLTPKHAQSSSDTECHYSESRNGTARCANECGGKPYDTCLCPCIKGLFLNIGCQWAQNMTCGA